MGVDRLDRGAREESAARAAGARSRPSPRRASPLRRLRPAMSTSMTPPRGMPPAAIRQRLSSSFTEFLGASRRGAFQSQCRSIVAEQARATFSASPVSIDAPSEPAAPKASRQNCSRAEAETALFLMRSIATARISSSSSPSSTSRPLTIAPTGLMTSWQTREHSSAARSSGARETIVKRRILWSMPRRRRADAASG